MASSRCIARWRCEGMTRRGSAIGIPANILGGETVNKQEFHERLINSVECELSYVQQFEDNVEKGIAGIRSTDDDAAIQAHAKSIAYNKRMKVIHLERAAAMLEVVGCFVQDRDEPTPLTIRNRLKMFKAKEGLEKTEE